MEKTILTFLKNNNEKYCVNVPIDTVERWEKIIDEFNKIQDEMSEYEKKKDEKKPPSTQEKLFGYFQTATILWFVAPFAVTVNHFLTQWLSTLTSTH